MVATGSWETLEVQPKAKGMDTRSELLKFYENNYSANLMQLVVYAKGATIAYPFSYLNSQYLLFLILIFVNWNVENLDDIQNLVESKFETVRNISRNPFDFSGEPCSSEHLQVKIFYI